MVHWSTDQEVKYNRCSFRILVGSSKAKIPLNSVTICFNHSCYSRQVDQFMSIHTLSRANAQQGKLISTIIRRASNLFARLRCLGNSQPYRYATLRISTCCFSSSCPLTAMSARRRGKPKLKIAVEGCVSRFLPPTLCCSMFDCRRPMLTFSIRVMEPYIPSMHLWRNHLGSKDGTAWMSSSLEVIFRLVSHPQYLAFLGLSIC